MINRKTIAVLCSLALLSLMIMYWFVNAPQSSGNLSAFAVGSMAAFEENKDRPLAPAFEFSDATGRALKLGDYKGKVLLVNFWATWCAPCVYELPALDRLQAQLGGDDFEVLIISLDLQGMERVQPYLENLGIQTLQPLVDTTNSLARALDAAKLPTTLLFDRHGRELGRLTGPVEWDDPDAIAFMQYVMKEAE